MWSGELRPLREWRPSCRRGGRNHAASASCHPVLTHSAQHRRSHGTPLWSRSRFLTPPYRRKNGASSHEPIWRHVRFAPHVKRPAAGAATVFFGTEGSLDFAAWASAVRASGQQHPTPPLRRYAVVEQRKKAPRCGWLQLGVESMAVTGTVAGQAGLDQLGADIPPVVVAGADPADLCVLARAIADGGAALHVIMHECRRSSAPAPSPFRDRPWRSGQGGPTPQRLP